METIIDSVIVLGSFVAGILVERHNATKINSALVEAQKLLTAVEIKLGVVKTPAGSTTIPTTTP
jgi:hypothetical protein